MSFEQFKLHFEEALRQDYEESKFPGTFEEFLRREYEDYISDYSRPVIYY